MTPERWQRIGALFDKVIAQPEHAREAAVRASPESLDIQDEVLSLMRAHNGGTGFLEPASRFADGARIGQYRIVRMLGRGGMGVVYLAEDSRLHRQVALKALPPHLFGDERLRSRLRKEARAAAALSHPSIATVYALEEIDDQVFIATEYLEGQTLREELEAAPPSVGLAISTGAEIARALAAAHAGGVVHRDLKPENIVRVTSGSVKILDFGLAQFDPAVKDRATGTVLTETGMMAGTPLYMAPEQLLGQPTSIRTDHFAFGVLLYELVMHRHPFGTGSLPSIIARVLAGEPDGPTGFDVMPDAVWKVVERCLRRNPADRFEKTSDLVAALETAASDVPGRPPTRTSSASGTLSTSSPPSLAQNKLASFGEVSPKRPAAAEADTRGTVGAYDPVWWWQFHQLTTFTVYWAMVWPVWHVRGWVGRAGVLAFLVTLATVIVAGMLRLHLRFTARTYPTELATQRRHVGRWLRAADYGFAGVMVVTGITIAEAHNGWGALLVSMGVGAVLAFLIIEPTTARAAFGDSHD